MKVKELFEHTLHPWQIQTAEEIGKLGKGWGFQGQKIWFVDPNTSMYYLMAHETPQGTFVIKHFSDECHKDMWVEYEGGKYLPFQCDNSETWPGKIVAAAGWNKDLTSFIGFPERVRDVSYLNESSKIKSLEGCPSSYDNAIHIDGSITKYGLCKFIKKASKIRMVAVTAYLGYLSFLKIKLSDNEVEHLDPSKVESDALRIVKKHLKGSKSVLECQEELIQNSLKQFAKL